MIMYGWFPRFIFSVSPRMINYSLFVHASVVTDVVISENNISAIIQKMFGSRSGCSIASYMKNYFG